MSEHDEQKTLFDWIRLNREHAPNLEVRKALKLCYAVPNGFYSKSHKVVNDMKAEGLTKGILDVNLDWPVFNFICNANHLAGLRIEHKFRASISAKIQAKIDTGNYIVDLSPEQKEKRELLIEAGYKVVVSYSAVQSIRTIFEYLPFKIEDYQGIREYL
jgi:hypothetical protein